MIERVNILKPILHAAVAEKVQHWPTYDGKTLDRKKYVSASEIGKCERQVWFGKNVPPSEGNVFYWGYAERGHSHEAWIVEQLRAYEHQYGWNYIGDEQVSFYEGYQSGTPDGIFHDPTFYGVVDFKSIDPRKKTSLLPADEHVKQLVQNMDLVEHCLDLDVDGALLVYSDASDYSKTHEFWIDRSSPQVGEMMVQLEERAERIMTAKGPEDLQPEGIYSGKCNQCIFQAQCSGAITLKRETEKRHVEIGKAATGVFG